MDRGMTEKEGKGKRIYDCQHGKSKYDCKECGRRYCEPGKGKRYCMERDGAGHCEHGKNKYECREGGGRAFCEHEKYKYVCKDCDGRRLCKTAHCTTIKNSKYKGHCSFCFVHLYPTERVARNYKTKENHVTTFLKEKFPGATWKCDKRVEDGCTRRRPDLLLDMGTHIVIVEVDENSHDGYDPTCEEKRLGKIWGDVHHRKIVFVQFNTDKYEGEDGNNVPSPWRTNKLGAYIIYPKWKAAWEARLETLRQTVEHRLIESSTKEGFEMVHPK